MREQLIIPLIEEIAKELKIQTHIEPKYGMWGMLIFNNGNRFYFKDVNFNINCTMSTALARDKEYCSYFMSMLGINTPDRFLVFNKGKNKTINLSKKIDESLVRAQNIGFPVIIKPNNMSKGSYIFKAENSIDFVKFMEIVLLNCDMIQVQKFYKGNDYRIVVLGDKVISAYQRVPLYIVGDGKYTVQELLSEKQRIFFEDGRDTIIDIYDIRLLDNLLKEKLSSESIVEKGRMVQLHDVSNLSLGGTCVELTEQIHPSFQALAKGLARDMDLALCGIDIITKDLTQEIDSKYIVLEINSAPGLDNYAYKNEQQQIHVKNLYREILIFIKNKYDGN